MTLLPNVLKYRAILLISRTLFAKSFNHIINWQELHGQSCACHVSNTTYARVFL